MSDIKMSDVVELPIDPNDMLIDSDIADDDSDREFLQLAAEAINQYDANQERIAELESGIEVKDARTLERINRIERQDEEIEALQLKVIYQALMHNKQFDLGIEREKKIAGLEDELVTEQDIHASMIKLAEQSK